MGWVLFFSILIMALVAALTLPLKFSVLVHLGGRDNYAEVFFHKLLKAELVWSGGSPRLSVFLFHIRLFKTDLKRKAGHAMLWLKSAVILNRKADIYYGTVDPFTTGMASGAFGVAAAFLQLDKMNMHPDFFAPANFLKVEASAEIMAGNTIINYAKNKK
jgi:hypothetical protein